MAITSKGPKEAQMTGRHQPQDTWSGQDLRPCEVGRVLFLPVQPLQPAAREKWAGAMGATALLTKPV